MSKRKEAIILKSSFEEPDLENDPYIQKLEDLNINCHPIKSLDFCFCNTGILAEKMECPDDYDGIIFTSPRCVAAVEQCQLELNKWTDKFIFAVGEKTAEEVLTKLSLHADGQSSGNSANLASYILNFSGQIKKPLLVPCGNLSKDTLSSALSKGGLLIEKITVYRTFSPANVEEAIQEVLDRHKISFIVCFSPSSVVFTLPVLQRNRVHHSVEWIAIGPTTGRAILDNGLRLGCVAENPTPESLAKAMKEFLG